MMLILVTMVLWCSVFWILEVCSIITPPSIKTRIIVLIDRSVLQEPIN